MKFFDNFLQEKSFVFLGFISSILILIIAVLDYLSGYEINFFVFYAAPIWVASWYGNRHLGRLFAVISVVTWYGIDLMSGNTYSNAIVPYWNGLIRFSFFLFVVYTSSTIKAKLKLEELNADYDSLTGLLNSRGFREKSDTIYSFIKRAGQPYTLVFIDVDNFKHINDTMGHAEGDKVLIAVSFTMKSSLRSTDIVGRLGGDEFVIFLPSTNSDQAKIVVDNLKNKLDDAVQLAQWPVGFSMGVSTFDSQSVTVHEAIETTDALMYKAKKNGKGRVVYN